MCIRDRVRTTDLRLGDRDDAPAGGQCDLAVGDSDELSGEALGAPLGSRPRGGYRARLTCAYAGAASHIATEVRGLGQWAFRARRGDLERVALAQLAERCGDALAQCERDSVGMVDEHAQGADGNNLGKQHL